MKKIFILLSALFVLVLAGCSDNEKSNGIMGLTIANVPNDTLRLMRYDKYQIEVDVDGPGENIRYFTSNGQVFSVTSGGVVEALDGGVGELIINYPTSSGRYNSVKCLVMVTALVDEVKADHSKDNTLLKVGGTTNIASAFSVYPRTAADKSIEYISSDPSIATVNDAGVVTQVSKGVVEITARSKDGGQVVSEPIKIYSGYSLNDLSKTGWVATASSTAGGSYVASKVIDGSLYSYWHSAASVQFPQWVLIDMGAAKTFDQLKVSRRNGNNYRWTKTVRAYITSKTEDGITGDDTSFEIIFDTFDFGPDVSGGPVSIIKTRFPDGASYTSRYIKLEFPDTNKSTPDQVSLAEVVVSVVE